MKTNHFSICVENTLFIRKIHWFYENVKKNIEFMKTRGENYKFMFAYKITVFMETGK